MPSLNSALISSTPSNVPVTSCSPYLNPLYIQASDIFYRYVMCAWIVWIWSLSPSNHPRPDHAPFEIVIQSEHLKHSISPENQSVKHPCFGISGVVIGSALSKGWRSGPEAFRAEHFLRLDRNLKPRMKSLWHPPKKRQTTKTKLNRQHFLHFTSITPWR